VIWVGSGYNIRDTYLVGERLIEFLKLNIEVYTPKMTTMRWDCAHGGIPEVDVVLVPSDECTPVWTALISATERMTKRCCIIEGIHFYCAEFKGAEFKGAEFKNDYVKMLAVMLYVMTLYSPMPSLLKRR
jgi:hypothetical protein